MTSSFQPRPGGKYIKTKLHRSRNLGWTRPTVVPGGTSRSRSPFWMLSRGIFRAQQETEAGGQHFRISRLTNPRLWRTSRQCVNAEELLLPSRVPDALGGWLTLSPLLHLLILRTSAATFAPHGRLAALQPCFHGRGRERRMAFRESPVRAFLRRALGGPRLDDEQEPPQHQRSPTLHAGRKQGDRAK
jgi:hypothetical protein